jgi:hypothetical protein
MRKITFDTLCWGLTLAAIFYLLFAAIWIFKKDYSYYALSIALIITFLTVIAIILNGIKDDLDHKVVAWIDIKGERQIGYKYVPKKLKRKIIKITKFEIKEYKRIKSDEDWFKNEQKKEWQRHLGHAGHGTDLTKL